MPKLLSWPLSSEIAGRIDRGSNGRKFGDQWVNVIVGIAE